MELLLSSLGEMREWDSAVWTYKHHHRGDEDEGFSSMEPSSSSLGETREKIRQYGTIIIFIRGDEGMGFSSMEL